MIRRVPWDGPNPAPGDFLAGPNGGLFRITGVVPLRRPDCTGARLALDMVRHRLAEAPQGVVVHPAARTAPAEPTGPSRVRQTARDGMAAVMKNRWRDPDDARPNAVARPRLITGYRTYCPLRRMAEQKGSQVTDIQVAAADHFRAMHDLARIGYVAERDAVAVTTGYGPKPGPSAQAMAQAGAAASVNRAMARFAPGHAGMLSSIVLRNHSLFTWCAEEARRIGRAKPLDAKVEMGKLLAILDILADHYDAEVEHLMQTDRALAIERA